VLGGFAAKMMNMYEQEKITPYHDGEKAAQVEQMFDNIAPTYDTLNHRLSWDIDKGWRKKAIKALAPYQPQSLLDIATGTGDFAILATQMLHPERVVGADISEGMMQIGREKVKALGLENVVTFEKEDCTHLSYNNDTFDAVTAAFGIRNFADLDQGLREMCRVLRPGGHLSIVELTTPPRFPMKQLFWVYSHVVLPVYGRLVSKDRNAYTYLQRTIEAFPQGETMMTILQKAGFRETAFQRLTFGICTLYTATK
jgi:demethylmenaquinone methyltransferase/2-methoxy-6-polyprenyl-1,4-benzoquinol methylase